MSNDFSTQMQDRLWQEIDDLKAQLAQAEKERDTLAHWRTKYHELAAENERLEGERDAARQAAGALRKWGANWREIAWGYEVAWGENVQIFDNKAQLWASSRPRDCMGRRVTDD